MTTDSDPLRETELLVRASGDPFLLALAFRVFRRIALIRWVMFLSASGYTSRNRLSSLPKLGKTLVGMQWDKECVNLPFVFLKYHFSLTMQTSSCSPHQTSVPFRRPIPQS